MAVICITGGTGLVGKRLTKRLCAAGHEVVILTRNPRNPVSTAQVRYAAWNVEKQTIDAEAIANCDYIIHLAGAGVAEKRWTKARKQEIRDSRVKSGTLLSNTLRSTPNKVKAIVSASAIGWYGPDRGKVFTEEDVPFGDFLGTTCREWEESIAPVQELGIRRVTLRIGIVLTPEGGALAEFMKPVKLGVASILGSGKQMISWIHIDDLCRMMEYAILNEQLQGIYNAAAPQPVSNRDLSLQLAKKMRGSFFIPVHVPAFALKIILGEMSIEVLKSCTVSSAKISAAGFQFTYPSIDAALNGLIERA